MKLSPKRNWAQLSKQAPQRQPHKGLEIPPKPLQHLERPSTAGFSIIYPTVTSFLPFPGMPGGPPSARVTLPSCLMPESFNASGDFENYLQQFNTAAVLAAWFSTET